MDKMPLMTQFNRTSALLAALAFAFALTLSGCSSEAPETAEPAAAPQPEQAADTPPPAASMEKEGLDILILGGTGFIGPHMVRRALERGHTVTLFNRGKTNQDLFPDVETLIGDRDSQLGALEGRTWDAVIDNSGYVPRHCRESAQLLAGSAKQYLFISSVSAYGDFSNPPITEDTVLARMEDETVEEVTGATYGPMKVLCEEAVAEAFPNGTTIVRPGYIVGPGDSTDRWTYWPLRVAAGGDMLVPGTPDDPVQIIDARDLAKFVILALENNTLGTFNAVGPADRLPMGTMLDTIKAVTGSEVTFTWVDAAWLEGKGAFFPIWASPDGDFGGGMQTTNERGKAAGMTFTPLEDTVRDTLEWWQGLDEERQMAMRAGLRVFAEPPTAPPPPVSLDDQLAEEAALLEAYRSAE